MLLLQNLLFVTERHSPQQRSFFEKFEKRHEYGRASSLQKAADEIAARNQILSRFYKNAGTEQGDRRQAEPDWAMVHRELKRKHVTLSVLWDEYIERQPDGYRYSRFCDLYRSWEGKLSVTMHQGPMPAARNCSSITPVTGRR